MAPERFAPTSLPRRPIVFWVFFTCWVLLTGCSSPAPVVEKAESPPAHLVIINLTDYRWQIMIVRPPAAKIAEFEVSARESRSMDLAAGAYTIKQTVLSENASNELSRELPAKFEPGESYRWRLATLLSETPETPSSP